MGVALAVVGPMMWLYATFQTVAAATQDHAQVTCGLTRIQAQTELTRRDLLDSQVYALGKGKSDSEQERRSELTRKLEDAKKNFDGLQKVLREKGCS